MGCTDYHQVKMCYSSMNTRQCGSLKDCENGYHVKGTVTPTKGGKKEELPKFQKKEQEKEKPLQEKEGNISSFFL